jgi:hypothetical protein
MSHKYYYELECYQCDDFGRSLVGDDLIVRHIQIEYYQCGSCDYFVRSLVGYELIVCHIPIGDPIDNDPDYIH